MSIILTKVLFNIFITIRIQGFRDHSGVKADYHITGSGPEFDTFAEKSVGETIICNTVILNLSC
jgi:hypothetical protein